MQVAPSRTDGAYRAYSIGSGKGTTVREYTIGGMRKNITSRGRNSKAVARARCGSPPRLVYSSIEASAANERDAPRPSRTRTRSEEHTSELQSRENLVCRLLLEKKKKKN